MSAELRKKTGFNTGLILGIISLVSVVVQYATGEFSIGRGSSSTFSTVTSIVVFAVGVYLIIRALNTVKRGQGYLSFGEGFKVGFTAYIVSSLFTVAWLVVYCYVLEPDYQEQILDQTADQMYEQNPNMSEEQIETALGWTAKFTGPFMMITFGVMGAALFGAIVSLILAAIIKKDQVAFVNDVADTEENNS